MLAVALLMLSADAGTARVAEIYRSDDDETRREVLSSIVFVPGILGSQLVDSTDGRLYWGAVLGESANPAKGGADLVKVALPLAGAAADVPHLDDELDGGDMLLTVAIDTPIGELHARGYPGVFEGLAATLLGESGGTRVSVKDARDGALPFVAFGYDWRQDLSVEASRLHEVVQAAAAKRKAAGGPERVTLVGHSMGALLVRYYLRYGDAELPQDGPLPEPTWAGAAYVSDVLLMAPPNAGSSDVLDSFREGEKVSTMLPKYPPSLVAMFPSMYQMLPRVRHGTVIDPEGAPVDLYDVEVWRDAGLGPFAPDQEALVRDLVPLARAKKRREALTHHVAACLARAERMHAALDLPATPPSHLRMHLFAGDQRNTQSVLELDRQDGSWSWAGKEAGDGRVTRRSALLDERSPGTGGRLDSPIAWTTVWFGDVEHFGISGDTAFLDNALYLLLEHPWDSPPPSPPGQPPPGAAPRSR